MLLVLEWMTTTPCAFGIGRKVASLHKVELMAKGFVVFETHFCTEINKLPSQNLMRKKEETLRSEVYIDF